MSSAGQVFTNALFIAPNLLFPPGNAVRTGTYSGAGIRIRQKQHTQNPNRMTLVINTLYDILT